MNNNKIYTITVNELDCNGNVGNSATWHFTDSLARDNVLDYIDTLGIEENFEIEQDEFFANTEDQAKKEVFNFVNGDYPPEMWS